MEQQKQITYKVPVVNMPWLMGRIEELNKKAHKLDTPAIVFNIIRTYTKRTKDSHGREYDKMMNEITISGIAPKLAGWSFLGTIQHTENGNVVRAINEIEIPVEYRTVKRACDHCKKDRNRKDTYLVVSESKEFKQLGKACLKDYTGHISPAHLAALAEFIDQLNNGEDSEYESNGKFELLAPSLAFLRMACEAVVKQGAYITRKQTEITKGFATSEYAWTSLFPPKKSDKSDFIPLTETPPGESLFSHVIDSLAELDTQKNKTSFEHNVLVACRQEMIARRDIGLVAAAIMLYEKNLIKKIDLKKNQESAWVGAVKEKREFDVVVYKKLGFETAFGYMRMILMKDTAGNVFMWKTGTGFSGNISVGDNIKIKGTIKKHDEYQGVKQTILTRCSLLEEKAIANQ